MAAERWTIERTLAWLGHQRRPRVDDECLPVVVEALIALTMIRILVRRLTRSPTS